jgi:hypothetical protein
MMRHCRTGAGARPFAESPPNQEKPGGVKDEMRGGGRLDWTASIHDSKLHLDREVHLIPDRRKGCDAEV